MAQEIHLTSTEANDLIISILEGVAALDEETEIRPTWTNEMRDWCDLLAARLWGGDT